MDNHSLRVFYARPIDCKKGTVGTFFMNVRDLNDNADVHKGLATRLARPRSPYSGGIPTAESQQQVYRHNSGMPFRILTVPAPTCHEHFTI